MGWFPYLIRKSSHTFFFNVHKLGTFCPCGGNDPNSHCQIGVVVGHDWFLTWNFEVRNVKAVLWAVLTIVCSFKRNFHLIFQPFRMLDIWSCRLLQTVQQSMKKLVLQSDIWLTVVVVPYFKKAKKNNWQFSDDWMSWMGYVQMEIRRSNIKTKCVVLRVL